MKILPFPIGVFWVWMALSLSVPAAPLSPAFTYQGLLADGTHAANGVYDLRFALFDAPADGSQLGLSVTYNDHPVSNGLFTVTLDFGTSPFAGEARWLQIQVATNGGGPFTLYRTLSPRQPLTPAPYALHAANAGTALSLASGAVSNLSLAPGAVTSDKIADGTLTAADLSPALAASTFWRLGGNAGTVPGSQFLGTTDNQPLEFKISGQRALRLEPGVNGAPNVVGGSVSNRVAAGVIGATLAGGGNSLDGAHRIEANYGSIGGGYQNTLQTGANHSTIAGGYGNTMQTSTFGSSIGGGAANTVQTNAILSAIGGGSDNLIQANAKYSIIAGGQENKVFADAYRSTISGGSNHRIGTDATNCFIGGGFSHFIQFNVGSATIAGGERNSIYADSHKATISGGANNTIQTGAYSSAIGGGNYNNIQTDSPNSTIGGGSYNLIRSDAFYSSIGGGANNLIQTNANSSTISGGRHNTIEGYASDSVIGGGSYNTNGLGAYYSTISGGGGNRCEAPFASVPGGADNSAVGSYSLAAGRRAQAMHRGTFVWADTTNADYASTGNDQFCIRAAGGVQLSPITSLYCGSQTRQMLNLFSTNYGIGVQGSTLYFRTGGDQQGNGFAWYRGGSHNDAQNNSGGGATLMTLNNAGLTVNGTFVSSSDRNRKENFATVSPREVLDKVAALPISRWNFKGDSATPHVGPMAQDFHAAFGVGTDDKHIATVDADGVALAAIQGLNQKVDDRVLALEREIKRRDAENAELKERLARLEKLLENHR